MEHSRDEQLMDQIIMLVQQFRRQAAVSGGAPIPRPERNWPPEGHGPNGFGRFGPPPDRAGSPGERPEFGAFHRAPGRGGPMEHPFDRRPPMARERALHIIGEEPGVSQRRLAAYLSIRPQSLSELLGKLERDGYITRTQNENDKREILVYLTEKGKHRAEEVELSRSEQAARWFDPLTEEEKQTLSSLLEKLLSRYEEA